MTKHILQKKELGSVTPLKTRVRLLILQWYGVGGGGVGRCWGGGG
jgi:hypothetical protein